MSVIVLSTVVAALGLVGTALVERRLQRGGARGPVMRGWLLGLAALGPAWVIALVGVLGGTTDAGGGVPRVAFLVPSAVAVLGVIASDAWVRHRQASARPPGWVTGWLSGVAALGPAWALTIALLAWLRA